MAVVNDCSGSFILMDESNMKNNHESSDAPVLPSSDSVNNSCVLKSSGNENVDTEPCERRKKTRRGKPKRKNPYNKEGNESRKAGRTKNRPRFAHRHADAPYNTNEFLMEDHNSFVKLNSPPSATQKIIGNIRPPRVRDPSFTSVDSDEDHFYSSPEDEEEFLTKEFSNTYQDLHVESLQGMNKSELIQQVLQLEEKVDNLEKRLGNRTKADKESVEKFKISTDYIDDTNSDKTSERVKQFQLEIGRLRIENEKLQIENDRLRRRNRSSSVSSVDSESDSTTSSPSSVSDLSDREELLESNISDSKDDPGEKFNLSNETNNLEVSMEEKPSEESGVNVCESAS